MTFTRRMPRSQRETRSPAIGAPQESQAAGAPSASNPSASKGQSETTDTVSIAQAVEPSEIGRLLDERGASLALYASQWTSEAEDCVQEALIELARQPLRPEHLMAWLYRVVKNRALNRARSANRRKAREEIAWQKRIADRPASTEPGDQIDLIQALGSLRPDAREVVLLRIEAGLTFAEVGAIIGCSSSAAHRRYYLALRTLRRLLGEENNHQAMPDGD